LDGKFKEGYMAGLLAHIAEMKNAYRILVIRVKEKLGGCSWIHLAQDWEKW
jgi:hypothetical protein